MGDAPTSDDPRDATSRARTFARLLETWESGDPRLISDVITDDYRGHMEHLVDGERDAQSYPEWIRAYRAANDQVTFEVLDQRSAGDLLWSRLRASRPDGSIARGMNCSRFQGDRIAEEWAIWTAWFTSPGPDATGERTQN